MSEMETSDLCRKPDFYGVFHPRCRHIIEKPRGEDAPRQCRRAAGKNERFCDAHREPDSWAHWKGLHPDPVIDQ